MLAEGLQTVLGVELHSFGHNSYGLRYCQLNRKNNELHIQGKKTIEGTLGAVLAILPKGIPVALTLTGKGIIHKNIQSVEEATDHQRFQQAFPATEQKNFYVQHYQQGANGLLSIMRKEGVDELLEKLRRAGLKIYMFSLGGMPTVHIWPQLNFYGTTLQYAGHGFVLTEERHFVSYSTDVNLKSPFPIKIEQEPIPEENLLAYASAFQLILHDKLQPITANVESVEEEFATYLANAQLKKKAIFFLMALFMVLLVSFLLFSHYNQQNEQLLREVGAQTASADQVDLLKKEIVKNEQLLKELQWNGGYNYGWLLNEIGSSMPRQLTLQEVLLNDFRTEEEKTERRPNIKITGTTANLTAVNNWIFVLKEKTWVKNAKLQKFQEDPESDNYQFNILITY
jgi:Tfp pilus assembly protein PilN